MTPKFTWVPLYTELAALLLDWEDRQADLIEACRAMREAGLKVSPLMDKDKDGRRFLVQEMDPFSFFANFNRGIREDQRRSILREVSSLLGARQPLPEDFSGIPLVNNQRSWFFAYSATRGRKDIPTLWQMFRLALSESPLQNPDFATCFDRTLALPGVATNLTMGLFWIRPDTFLNLDSVNREYLEISLPPGGLNYSFYTAALQRARSLGRPFPEISYAAWPQQNTSQAGGKPLAAPEPLEDEKPGYWFVGAYWDDQDEPDRTPVFLAEGIWQNGYRDKYLDQVRSMKVGDRIAIKAASTMKKNLPFDAGGRTVSRMTIKAAGTIVANRGDGRTVEVEWDFGFWEKDWFFYTSRATVWQLKTNEEYRYREFSQRLIAFVWQDQPQDYEWFCDYWYRDSADGAEPPVVPDAAREPYGVEDVIDSGVFLTEDAIHTMHDRFRVKKNLILQGPPGVGKTFIARKLAYALMNERAADHVETVQFHQSYSYEDFIRGFRPLEEPAGAFGLQDAVFYRFCKRAEEDPDNDYVFIIDEINRGNLSQIFGELLMLIEADKRGKDFAVPLMYRREGESPFSVPENVHLLGLMNIADRSLSIVDYALRRRFAFVSLRPEFESPVFREWLAERDMAADLIALIVERMTQLNRTIAKDPLLGENYCVGHSFFCPRGDDFSSLGRKWFDAIATTEIVPLLREYWFDSPRKADDAGAALTAS